VRFFPDGRSAILNTYNCGFYFLSGLDGDAPTLEPVLALEHPKHIGCGVPLLIGKWWIMPIPSTHEFVVFALDPGVEVRPMALVPLSPVSICQHFDAASDAHARLIVEDALELVARGKCSVDSDFRRVWQHMLVECADRPMPPS
jgi:hypothetical protein